MFLTEKLLNTKENNILIRYYFPISDCIRNIKAGNTVAQSMRRVEALGVVTEYVMNLIVGGCMDSALCSLSSLTVALALQEQAESLRDLGRLLLQHHGAVRDLKMFKYHSYEKSYNLQID